MGQRSKTREEYFFCKTENFVPVVIPGLSYNSGTSWFVFPSPPWDSSSDDGAPGNWRDAPKTQGRPIARPSVKVRGVHTKSGRYRSACTAPISHDSGSERPPKVLTRKQGIYTHFPKDRNCEVCLRNQDDKGSSQEANWRSSTSSRTVW